MPTYTSDVQINKAQPAVEYGGSSLETGGVWHEDREIAVTIGTSTVSKMYRVYNATFSGTSWSKVNNTFDAFATVQNEDGSTSYLTNPPGTSSWGPEAWVGSGNHTQFNAADFGMVPGGDAGINFSALQSAIDAAVAVGGGKVCIPAGVYPINGVSAQTIIVPGSVGTGPTYVGLVIEGCGGSTQLAQQANADLFNITDANNERGVRFRDLRITYGGAKNSMIYHAIYATTDDVICEGCYFENWPMAFYMGGPHNGIITSTIYYNGQPGNETTFVPTMIDMEKADDFVDDCYFHQMPVNMGGPAGCVCVLVGGASEPRISNTNINDFDKGLIITGGTTPVHGFFGALACECNDSAVIIEPNGNNALIYQLFFDGCVFERTSASTSSSAGVLIKTAGAAYNQNVSDIFFSNCMSHDWGGPGIQIDGGQDIVVTGGRFGSNATDPSMMQSGGIAVTGPAVRVTIVGADFYGLIPPYPAQPNTTVQPYGISVTGTVVGMQVRSCNLSSNHTGPLYVNPNDADLRVTDCVGYNDLNTTVSTIVPTLVPQHSANLGYYGPSLVTFSNATSLVVTILTTTYNMTFGTIPLLSGDAIKFSGTPSVFKWTGK